MDPVSIPYLHMFHATSFSFESVIPKSRKRPKQRHRVRSKIHTTRSTARQEKNVTSKNILRQNARPFFTGLYFRQQAAIC